MTDLSVEHRGHTIRYSENSDEWTCLDLGISSPTLSGAKGKINAEMLKLRKSASFACYYLENEHSGSRQVAKLTDVVAMDFKTVSQRTRWAAKPHGLPKVGIMSPKGAKGASMGKQWRGLHDLVPVGPKTDEAMAKVRELHTALVKARSEYDAAIEAIPRLRPEDVEELAAASKGNES